MKPKLSSRLLEFMEEGETIVIARHGKPAAELIRARHIQGFPLGTAREEPLTPAGDHSWQPMTDEEAERWTGDR